MDKNTQTRLSEHFTLEEMCRSGAAVRHRIDNTPDREQAERLRQLCLNVLEPLRRRFGVIRITSGFRSERLNAIVGGANTSQHMRGEAADITVAFGARPPSRISSQPIMLRPFSVRNFSASCIT